jgi:predicted nucleic acid-binding protein
VKLVIEEPESAALRRHLRQGQLLATSRITLVEVPRATAIANPSDEVQRDTARLLASCLLVDVSDALLRAASGLASATVRTLDAIHVASALRIEADELVAYDRRLAAAGAEHGLDVIGPGALR